MGMQTYHRVDVQLGKKDRKQIAERLNKGRESARVLRRALILRQLDQGHRAAQVAVGVGVAPKTVRAIARRYEDARVTTGSRGKTQQVGSMNWENSVGNWKQMETNRGRNCLYLLENMVARDGVEPPTPAFSGL